MRRRKGFTLVELLVIITIIGILASVALGALQVARQSAREYATKATIAKLHNIIMQRYESYLMRRVAFDTTGLPPQQIGDADRVARSDPKAAARFRLDAIRDTIRMEMPDALTDVTNGPIPFTWGHAPEPALHKVYAAKPPTADHDAAQCLYMVVSMGSPVAMEQFNQSEIGMVDGRPCFVDGWGQPIMWLRWAPGASTWTKDKDAAGNDIPLSFIPPSPAGVSAIQTGNPISSHDPFDNRNIQPEAFNLVPLIYSAAGKRKPDGTPLYGIDLQTGYVFAGNPYANLSLGKPILGQGGEGNITNHQIEQR